MTVSLGGVVLAAGMLLSDPESESDMAMSVRPTFGAPVVQRCGTSGGKTLVILADKNDGAFRGGIITTAQKAELVALRDAGEPVELIHPQGKWWAIIPPTGIQLTSFYKKQTPGPDDPQVGTVTITTLGAKHD